MRLQAAAAWPSLPPVPAAAAPLRAVGGLRLLWLRTQHHHQQLRHRQRRLKRRQQQQLQQQQQEGGSPASPPVQAHPIRRQRPAAPCKAAQGVGGGHVAGEQSVWPTGVLAVWLSDCLYGMAGYLSAQHSTQHKPLDARQAGWPECVWRQAGDIIASKAGRGDENAAPSGRRTLQSQRLPLPPQLPST